MRAPTISGYYAIKERATHSTMAQRKLAAKWTSGRNTPFILFQNQRPNYNNHAAPSNPQRQYNLSNAPLIINNIPVPMDVGRAQSRNNWRTRGKGNLRGQWRGWANVADAGMRNTYSCFSCGEVGHFTKNCPQRQGKGKGGAKANLIDFNPEEDTLYEGS
jgi:hypothetical protein